MIASLLALASSLLWGTGDFLGGRASRGYRVLQVLLWSQVAALVLIWITVAVLVQAGSLELDGRTMVIGALGGMCGAAGLAAFYRALAIGPMSVVPPIAAAGVLVPVAVGLASGAAPSATVLGGIAVAITGVVLASVGEGHGAVDGVATRLQPRTLGLCLVAALGFGLIFVAMDEAAGETAATAVLATAAVRLGGSAVIAIAVLASRTSPVHGVTPRTALGFAGIGLLDTGANLTFAIAAALGELEVVAVLGSLYPAITSSLAHVVLGERLGRVQLVGVVCALMGVGVLAGA